MFTIFSIYHYQLIELLLNRGADINFKELKAPPLHLSAQSGNAELLSFFIKKGANLDYAATKGTPFAYALSGKNKYLTKKLYALMRQRNPEKAKEEAQAAYFQEVGSGHVESLGILLDSDLIDINSVYEPTKEQLQEELSRLNNSEDPETYKDELEECMAMSGSNAAHFAVFSEKDNKYKIETLRFLRARGIDILKKNSKGLTPLELLRERFPDLDDEETFLEVLDPNFYDVNIEKYKKPDITMLRNKSFLSNKKIDMREVKRKSESSELIHNKESGDDEEMNDLASDFCKKTKF